VPGEDLFVIGDLPQLGANKELKYGLMWTDGHIWVSESPLLTTTPYFSYKYVKVDRSMKIIDKEDGIQRVADLTLLQSQDVDRLSGSRQNSVEIFDMWQAFKIQFTIFHPLLSNN
jgi:hypothetical protein